MARHWVRSSDVIWEELDGETVLVEPRTNRTWLLNSTASFIWRNCDGALRTDVLARRLTSASRRELDGISADIAAFCGSFEELGLLRAVPQPVLQPVSGSAAARSSAGPYAPPRFIAHGLGSGPRHRPSPRGLSGPG